MAEFKPMTKDAIWEKSIFFFSDYREMDEAEMNDGVTC